MYVTDSPFNLIFYQSVGFSQQENTDRAREN